MLWPVTTPTSDRHRPALRTLRWTLTVSSISSAIIAFAPFARSGDRTRTSFELVDVAGRAGVLPSPYDRLAPVWYSVPAICGVVLLAVSLRRHRLAGASATTLGLLVSGAGVLVQRSVLASTPATVLAIPLGALTAGCGIAVLITARRAETT